LLESARHSKEKPKEGKDEGIGGQAEYYQFGPIMGKKQKLTLVGVFAAGKGRGGSRKGEGGKLKENTHS